MNIIFLDVYGVLNAIRNEDKEIKPYLRSDYPLNEDCMTNLAKLVELSNSYIVILSTPKYNETGKLIVLNEFIKYNLNNRLIGYTDPVYKSKERAVIAYLNGLYESVNYIIIDDDDEFKQLNDHFIHTNYELGLTETDVSNCLEKLKLSNTVKCK
jgi:hypothetical protein